MGIDGELDLSHFLTDSLCVGANIFPAARAIFPSATKNPYSKIIRQDPLEVLGEMNFSQPKYIPEDTVGTPIQEFYRGLNILITGGTGFIGKVLIEKLVRSVPHLGHIYLLIRAKRGRSPQERFNQLLEDKVFSRMKTEVPHYRTKISAVAGDISEPRLGLSAEDHQLLTDKVQVVFHSAADVKFNEPLKVAMLSNVVGSKRILDMAKEMKNLVAFIHVSTAFSQCVNRVIEEKIYKLSINYKEILIYVDSMSQEDEGHRVMQGWPNTYTFSKAVCEDMMDEEAAGLPVCIFRPSVVGPTYMEPVRGWLDNVYGPFGIKLGAGLGIIHCFRLDEDMYFSNTVPVDYVCNCMISAAWRTGSSRVQDAVPVYNFTLYPQVVSWKKIIDFATKYTNVWPIYQSIWYLSFFTTTSYVVDEISHLFLHKIPGKILDAMAVAAGQRPRLSKIYNTIYNVKKTLRFFVDRNWVFKNDNITDLWNSLSQKDKKEFSFDVRGINPLEMALLGKLGIRYYYVKEEMESIPAAEYKYKWLFWAHNTLRVVSGLVVLKLLVCLARALPI